MKNKIDYRLYAKELRKTLDINSISKFLVNKIRKNQKYISAKNIMLYYPLKYEIDLRDLLNDKKKFYLPRVHNENLLVCPYDKNKLIKSELNIFEPATEPVSPKLLDLIFVPALFIDKNGYRIGYGKGYYDRFLPLCANTYTITALPKELYTDNLPHDEFDIRINEIITI